MFNDKITFSPLLFFSQISGLKDSKELVKNANPIFLSDGTFFDNKQQFTAEVSKLKKLFSIFQLSIINIIGLVRKFLPRISVRFRFRYVLRIVLEAKPSMDIKG